MKILIIHDRFMFRGGAERLVLIMAKALQADIMTEFWIDGETFDRSEAPGKIFTLAKGDLKVDALRYFRAQFNFLFRTRRIIRNYDLVVFSGNNCLSASINLKKNQKHFLYCHAPVRHVFDLYKKFRSEQKNWLKKIVYYSIGAWGIRVIYWLGLSRFKTVIANSKNVQNRLQKYCHKDSQVIWPPIQVDKFKYIEQGDYYLSFGRVDKLKRVGDIVRAFAQMPDKKLIITSSGDDLENVKKLAKGYDNIKIIGWVSDDELKNYVGNCIATIYIPIDEDAGMVPLESNSAGKPCICNRDGGFVEIIKDEVNGKFIPKNYKIEDIVKAVNYLTPARALAMKEDCINEAQKYSEAEFVSKIKNVINSLDLNIAIDASKLLNLTPTGVENYCHKIIKGLISKNSNITLYTPRLIPNISAKQKVLRWPFRFWSQIWLGFELLFKSPDTFFSPGYAIPFVAFLNKKTIKIVTIHDVAFAKDKNSYSVFQNWFLNLTTRQACKYAHKIITPTKAVKQDLVKYFNCPENKVEVIHMGFDRIESGAINYESRKKQILYVGRIETKKNLNNLINAFEIFNKKYPDYKLILAGKPGFDSHKINLNVKNVEYLGYISEEQKNKLMRESACLAFLSKEEGFGFPLLEAFNFNLPVLASDIPTLKEIGEDACLYVDPNLVEAIAKSLELILTDENLPVNLATAGKNRLNHFSWEKCIDQTWEVLNK